MTVSFYSLLENLLDFTEANSSLGAPDAGFMERAAKSLRESIDYVLSSYTWSWTLAETDVATYATTPVTYTHDVNAKTVTLGSGSWPSWAAGAYIETAGVKSKILSVTGAVAKLSAGSTVSLGTTGTLVRYTVPIPSCRALIGVYDHTGQRWLHAASQAQELIKEQVLRQGRGDPATFAVNRTSKETLLHLDQIPSAAKTFTLLYRIDPVIASYLYVGDSPYSVTVNGTAITFSSAIPGDPVGSTLLVSDSSRLPRTSVTVASNASVAAEFTISARVSPTALTASVAGSNYVDRGYVITSKLDIPDFMVPPINRYAEYVMARMGGDKRQEERYVLAKREILFAMERDHVMERGMAGGLRNLRSPTVTTAV